MELREALTSTAAIRDFEPRPVPAEVLYRVLDTARFAPSGGNRQGWHVVVVSDPATRRALRDLYKPVWYEYLAQGRAGLVAWAPITDREAERHALAGAPAVAAEAERTDGGLAEHLDEVPVLAVVLADLRALAATDRDLDRYNLVGGASIYPFAWSVLLAAREEGLGGVMTTMLARRDREVREVLAVPDTHAVAAAIVLGYPRARPSAGPTRLRRRRVEAFATVDRFDGASLSSPGQPADARPPGAAG